MLAGSSCRLWRRFFGQQFSSVCFVVQTTRRPVLRVIYHTERWSLRNQSRSVDTLQCALRLYIAWPFTWHAIGCANGASSTPIVGPSQTHRSAATRHQHIIVQTIIVGNAFRLRDGFVVFVLTVGHSSHFVAAIAARSMNVIDTR